MTHITISDRVIAVEVENGCTGCKIHTPHAAFFAFYDTKPIRSAKRHILPPDKTYKFLCLASEVLGDNHELKKNPLFTGEFWLNILKLPVVCFDEKQNKEYALIEVQ